MKQAAGKVKKFLKYHWLPFALLLLFIAQTHLFNLLSELTNDFWFRRTLVAVGLGSLIYGPAIFFHRKSQLVYSAIASTVITMMMVANYVYYSYGGGFLSVSALAYWWQLGPVGATIQKLIGPELVFFILQIPLIILAYFTRKKVPKYKLSLQEIFISLGIIFFILSATYGYVVWAEVKFWGTAKRLYRPTSATDLVDKAGIIHYAIVDAVKYVTKRKRATEKEAAFVRNWAAKQPTQPTGGRYTGIAKGRNVIFIQLESFEAFPINRQIDGQDITPNLNKLIKDSLYFSNFYDQIGPGTTSDAEFSTLTSLYPFMDDTAFFSSPKNKYNTILSELKKQGYSTASLHGDDKNFWNRSAIYPSLGYERFYNIEDYKPSRKIGWGLGDQEFFEQSVPKLKSLSQPFWASTIAITSHTPFELPNDLKTLTIRQPSGISPYQENYLQSVRYVDDSLGKYLEQLKKEGLYDKSLIVVMGDHTASLATINEDHWAKFLGLGEKFEELSFLQSRQIPFIIQIPGSNIKGDISRPAGQVDVFPTLANLLGIKISNKVMGEDILNAPDPVVVKRQIPNPEGISGIFSEKLIYIATGNGPLENGRCLDAKILRDLPSESCRQMYLDQLDEIRVSDIVLRTNRIDLLE